MADIDCNRDYSIYPEASVEPDRSTGKKTKLAEERTQLAEERSELAEERSELAEERSELAKHRTLLANERTFSAWIRTGIALIGGGLTAAELLEGKNEFLPLAIGIILIIMGATVCIMALWRYNSISRVLEEKGMRVTPKSIAFILIGGMLLVTLLVLAFLLIE